MNFDNIDWPPTREEIDRVVTDALVRLLDSLRLQVGSRLREAVEIARRVAAGEPVAAERAQRLKACWDWLDETGKIGDMTNLDALEARLAICLLDPPSASAYDRVEELEWFFEMIEGIGVDRRAAEGFVFARLSDNGRGNTPARS